MLLFESFWGDIFIGVLDDGTVIGVPPKSAPEIGKNFITVISNPALFAPTIYLSPEIVEYEGHTIIHVHVSPSAEVHSYKKVIYDRVNDADVKITATKQIVQMYIRKQNVFTERKIYPYATIDDLRTDLLPRIRQMAVNHAGGSHPWESMTDEELLRSAVCMERMWQRESRVIIWRRFYCWTKMRRFKMSALLMKQTFWCEK